jgi:hypothetical protein
MVSLSHDEDREDRENQDHHDEKDRDASQPPWLPVHPPLERKQRLRQRHHLFQGSQIDCSALGDRHSRLLAEPLSRFRVLVGKTRQRGKPSG